MVEFKLGIPPNRVGDQYDRIFSDMIRQMNSYFNDFMQDIQSRAKEEKWLNELQDIINNKNWDTEVAHAEADELLIRLLKELGYIKLAVEFDKMDKWYA